VFLLFLSSQHHFVNIRYFGRGMKLIQKRVEGRFKNKMKSTRALQALTHAKGGKAAVVLGYRSIGWGSRFAPLGI
jgi:hypothetical protein